MPEAPTRTYAADHLRTFAERIFRHFGVPDADARQAADVLLTSDLRGIDSHGVARLRTYHDMLAHGRINPRPNIRVVRETPSTATVDGDNGLGLVVGPWANRVAMEKAEQAGSGWAAVANTNHYGIAGYYVLEALRRDLIGLSMTNSTKIVAPLWGAERMLGTNPIVIDMATSVVAYGKVEIAHRKQGAIPQGWAVDGDGYPTTDPGVMIAEGALLPLGADYEHGGHKGYCLAVMVDLLCCMLSGANWGPFTPPFALFQAPAARSVGKGIGHFFGALRIDGFIEPDDFKRQVDDWIRTFRQTRPAPGTDGPRIPGDPERDAEAVRRVQGIPLLLPVVEDLRTIAAETGIPFD